MVQFNEFKLFWSGQQPSQLIYVCMYSSTPIIFDWLIGLCVLKLTRRQNILKLKLIGHNFWRYWAYTSFSANYIFITVICIASQAVAIFIRPSCDITVVVMVLDIITLG